MDMYSCPVIFCYIRLSTGLALVAGEILHASVLATLLRPVLPTTAEAESSSDG